MNAIDQFCFQHAEIFAAVVCFVPLAIIAWLSKDNHGERVYVLPGDDNNG